MDPNEKARGAGGSQEPDPRGTSVALAAVPDPPVIGRGAQPSVLPQPPIINQQQINPFLVDELPTPFSRPPMQAPSHPPAHPPACQSGGAGSSASVAPPQKEMLSYQEENELLKSAVRYQISFLFFML